MKKKSTNNARLNFILDVVNDMEFAERTSGYKWGTPRWLPHNRAMGLVFKEIVKQFYPLSRI